MGRICAAGCVTLLPEMFWLAWPPDFSHGVRRMVGAMTGEKEKVEASSGLGEEHKEALVGEVLPPEKPVHVVVLFSRELKRQLGVAYVAIITAFIGKAKKGDLASIKLLVELVEKLERAEKISEEEAETLSQMLMREFHALQEEENGGSEETIPQEKAA